MKYNEVNNIRKSSYYLHHKAMKIVQILPKNFFWNQGILKVFFFIFFYFIFFFFYFFFFLFYFFFFFCICSYKKLIQDIVHLPGPPSAENNTCWTENIFQKPKYTNSYVFAHWSEMWQTIDGNISTKYCILLTVLSWPRYFRVMS